MVPDVAAQTVNADYRRQIVLMLGLAFTVRLMGTIDTEPDDEIEPIERIIDGGKRSNPFAWGVIGVVLLVASDFDSLGNLSRAFAGLILVAMLMSDGITAMETIAKIPRWWTEWQERNAS